MPITRLLSAAGTAIGRMLGRPDPNHPRLQVGRWSEAGADTLVVVAQGSERALGYVFRVDHATRVLTHGSGRLARCASHHDLRTVASAVKIGPASWRTLQGLGLVASNEESPLAQVLAYALRDGPSAAPSRPVTDSLDPRRSRVPRTPGAPLPHVVLTSAIRRMFGMDADQDDTRPLPQTYGFLPADTPRYSLPGQQPKPLPIEAPGRGRTNGIHSFPDAPLADRAEIVSRVTLLVHEAAIPIGAHHHPGVSELLGSHGWSPESYDWYAAPGEPGERRRQAGKLYPALAAPIATLPDVRACVDAGRPFEETLAEALKPLCMKGDSLAPAALRRMRTLPDNLSFDDLSVIVRWSARLPLDWLPERAEGWLILRRVAAGAHHLVSRKAFDLTDLARDTGRDWRALIGLGEPTVSEADDLTRFLESLAGAWDMAHHLRASLVSPVARSLGLPERASDEVRLACRILFAGKTARSVARSQVRWHAARTAIDAALPADVAKNAWPVPFAPFLFRDGISIACLSNETELRAEGGEGPDANGVAGLAHCVGGYGLRCYTAETVIASVRRMDGEGRMHRLSTVELVPSLDDPDGPLLTLGQHKAFDNADPPPEAVSAVDALLAAMVDGTHRVDADALKPRGADGYVDGYDWRLPGALEQAFTAWRTHLPTGTSHAGLQGLVERVRTETAEWPAEPEAPRRGFDPAITRMIVLAEGLPGGVVVRRVGA
jgi:hypothetical protein